MRNKRFDFWSVALLLSAFALVFTACHKDDEDDPKPFLVGRDKGFVDLGLSVAWAKCNIGAENPEDYGCYFAWGETATKITYDLKTYKYGSSFSKYNSTDGKTVLEKEDDAAFVNWGGEWRMPTDAEWAELRDTANCIWDWDSRKNGCKVTSKKEGFEGNFIFLPAAGYCSYNLLRGTGDYGNYWSRNCDEDSPDNAWRLDFTSKSVYYDSQCRWYGRSVRPVLSSLGE